MVRHLRPHSEGGHTYLRTEHFKQWKMEAYPGEQSKNPPWRERCMCLVDILQHMCLTGEIPRELRWTVLVLVPKGTTDTQDIGLLETLWKVAEALIDTCLQASLYMHNFLHRFRDGRGTGTDIMELKLAQELARIYQSLILLVFLDLRKAYDAVELKKPHHNTGRETAQALTCVESWRPYGTTRK